MFVVFLLPVLIVIISVYFVKRKFSYWHDRGVPFVKPTFPYGNLRGIGTIYHNSELLENLYKKLKPSGKPFGGLYFFIVPAVIAIDLEFIKTILVKDFQYFVNRGLYHNGKDDPLSENLVTIEDEKWKNLRSKLSPTFTSGKMKFMFPTIIKVGYELQKCMDKEIQISSEVNMKDILARYSTDVIGSVAFGLHCNSLNDPNAKFREMGKKILESPRHTSLVTFLIISFRGIAQKLGMKMVSDDVSKFFLSAVRETINIREQNELKHNDFMELLIRLKNDGNGSEEGLTTEQIAAQAFVFFVAGFETSSTTIACSLHELALQPDIQEKARLEILNVLAKNQGEFTYESLSEMHYIGQIINETLRKYPGGSNLLRVVKSNYKVPGTNYILEKGRKVFIPIYGIHRDPEYFPNPEEFDPGRFTDEAIKNRNPFCYMPFGEGPRSCIGIRFGLMQTKIGLAKLLLNFKFSKSSKTVIPLIMSKKMGILTPAGGLWLNVEKI